MSIKMLREALCREQARGDRWPSQIATAVELLIRMIDHHRPLGGDGKHGNRHTPTCGCAGREGELQLCGRGPCAGLDGGPR